MLHSLPMGKSEIPSSQWEYTFFTARKVGTGDFPLGNSGLLFNPDFSNFDETADFPTFRAIWHSLLVGFSFISHWGFPTFRVVVNAA